MKFKLLLVVLPMLFIGLGVSAATTSSSTPDDQGTKIRVCVDWETKEVRYSSKWQACPAKHTSILLADEGPMGPAGATGEQGPRGFSGSDGARGATTSLWDSLDTCYGKLQAAKSFGLLMAYKKDRDYFESVSGCVVEEIANESKIGVAKNMGFPVISAWKFKQINPGSEGEDSPFSLVGIGNLSAQFYVTIENADAISGLGDHQIPCLVDAPVKPLVQTLNPEVWIAPDVGVRFLPLSVTAQMTLGYMSLVPGSLCREFEYWQEDWSHRQPHVVIDVEPQDVVADREHSWYNSYLLGWGW